MIFNSDSQHEIRELGDLLIMKKLFLLSVIFLLLVLALGLAAKLVTHAFGIGEGLHEFALSEFIWGLLVLVTYWAVFVTFAPEAPPELAGSRSGVVGFSGAFCAGVATFLLGLSLFLLFGGTVTYSISVEATVVSLSAALGIAMIEEVLFRGLLFRLVAKVCPTSVTVLIVTVVFAVAHLDGRSSLAWATTLLLGFAFTIGLVQFRNLWVPIGLHAGSDFCTIFASGIPKMHGGFVKAAGSTFTLEFTYLVAAAALVLSMGILWLISWLRSGALQPDVAND
jgi:membrane protease YdiL (CAAX protease family)